MKPTATILCLFFAVTTIPVIANAGQARSSAGSASHQGGSQSSGTSAGPVKSNVVISKHFDKSTPKLFETTSTPKAPVTSK